MTVELVEGSQASTTFTELSFQITDFGDTLIGCADILHIRTGIREVLPFLMDTTLGHTKRLLLLCTLSICSVIAVLAQSLSKDFTIPEIVLHSKGPTVIEYLLVVLTGISLLILRLVKANFHSSGIITSVEFEYSLHSPNDIRTDYNGNLTVIFGSFCDKNRYMNWVH